MKKIILIMLMCICLLLSACKTNPYAKDEEIAMSAEKTQDAAAEQTESEQNTQAEKEQLLEQQKKSQNKEENLLPDEKEPSQSAPQEPEKQTPLVPIENGVLRREADYDGLDTQVLTSADYIAYSDLQSYLKKFTIEDCIIFKGVKNGKSTSVCSVSNGVLSNWYTETPIEVIDAYYGDIKPGQEIILKEMAVLLGEDKTQRVGIDSSTKLVKNGSEYIFFLAKSNKLTQSNKQMYSYVSMWHSVNEITQAHKKETEYTDKLGTNQFHKDVYTKYYYEVDKLDRRIDVQKETENLCATNGTKELSDAQKELLDKLIAQYGAK